MIPPLVTRLRRRLARHLSTKPFLMRNDTPIVSFTFDDVPETAYKNGARVLDEHAIRGTFYIASGTCGKLDTYWRIIGRNQVRDLHSRGHEIGCHTFSHRAVDQLDQDELNDECQRNFDNLCNLCPGINITNFCYPFGCVSLLRKVQLQKRFHTCRGIFEGINSGLIDLSLLKVIELYDRTLTRDKLYHVLRRAKEKRGWIIFYAHDVSRTPTHMGCTPELLHSTIEDVRKQGIPCLSVGDALPLIGYSSERPSPIEIDLSRSGALL
jgi:peptidoglycan/xylan/chitin deacetylase (PgdA/CDA1 family)